MKAVIQIQPVDAPAFDADIITVWSFAIVSIRDQKVMDRRDALLEKGHIAASNFSPAWLDALWPGYKLLNVPQEMVTKAAKEGYRIADAGER